MIDLHFRNGKSRHRKNELAVYYVKYEIRDNLLSVVTVGVRNLASRSRVQLQDAGHCRLEPFRSHSRLSHYAVEVLLGKFREMIPDNLSRVHNNRAVLQRIQLNQKAFPKIARAHTGRFKCLDYLQQGLHFLVRSLYPGPESHLVHEFVNVTAKVAVVIKTVDYVVRYISLVRRKIAKTKLFLQILRKGLLNGESFALRTVVVFAVVVGT